VRDALGGPLALKKSKFQGFQIPIKSQIPTTKTQKRAGMGKKTEIGLGIGAWSLGIDWDLETLGSGHSAGPLPPHAPRNPTGLSAVTSAQSPQSIAAVPATPA
jgi:hypothetical protein